MNRIAQIGIPGDLDQVVDTKAITVWDFVWAVVIIALSFLIAALTRRLVGRLLRKFPDIPQNYKLLMASASGWFVIVVGIIYALGVLGVDLGPALIGLLLVAGVAFFAGRGILENFSAGLVLQGTTMFVVGDQIETTAGTGTVLEITGRTLTIRTVDGKELNVPNTTVVNEPLTNLTKEGQRRSSLEVGVAYGTDLEEAKAALQTAAAGCELVITEPEPEALVSAFGDNAIEFELRFWHGPTIIEERRAVDAVARAVALELAEHDIEIAFPQRTLWWGEGQEPSDRAGNREG
jgi:small-conductance mechanosensitive channel